jgi:hypothetical protein
MRNGCPTLSLLLALVAVIMSGYRPVFLDGVPVMVAEP